MSQVRYLTFNTNAGGNQTIKVSDYFDEDEYVFYGEEYDKALSGYLRQRLRGTRKRVGISFAASVEQSEFRELFNNIAADLFDSGLDFITYAEGQDLTDRYRLVPSEEFRERMLYDYQFGHFSPAMSFVESDIRTGPISITLLDYGLITEAVDTNLDYGLITSSVTDTENFGTI